ncbi:Trehalose-phosphatase [Trinorchestia longiramus]|nr:Trehalose-phosphatase [Trinorchestia longiramus]
MVIHSTSPLVVVANRLPFVISKDPKNGDLVRKHSAGGLVTAVAPVIVETGGLWVGWSGLHLEDGISAIPESSPDDKSPTAGLKSEQVIPVNLPRKMFNDYYNGCCNACFWPLFHSMPDKAVFEEDKWEAYVAVNEEFAKLTMEAVHKCYAQQPDQVPLVWIHDYHLMYAANYIRNTCNDEGLAVKMAFFLHIPFPSWDIVRLFPWSDELLQGILGCDSVGFHLEDYCINFIDCCHRILGCRVDRKKRLIEHNKRSVSVHPLPISIPYDRFVKMAEEAPAAIKHKSEEQLLLGVDRLDYTKGLVKRFKAFERLLELYPQHIEKVTLLQIAVPSRTDVKEYQELKEELDQMIGRINGRFSTPNWSPIRYIYGSVTHDQLAAFYRDASVALVTPLRDGMNLVAKEFVACQIREPGVLVLSPFAGAGVTMQEALQVNPYEQNQFAKVIHRALTMPDDEREMRMQQLRRREKERDVNFWLREVLTSVHSLEVENGSDISLRPVSEEDFDQYLSDCVNEFSRLALILDYDGTLAPIAPHPDIAHLPEETKHVLQRLSHLPDVSIAIISGRSLENVKAMVGIEGITYAGNHGFEILHPDNTMFNYPVPSEYTDKLKTLREKLNKLCDSGAYVEDKGPCVSFHFRKVDISQRQALIEKALQAFSEVELEVTRALMSLEARPPVTWDSGRAAIHILRSLLGLDWCEASIIFAGDDDTDENAIEALEGMAVTFRVTDFQNTKTSANYRLADPDAVLTMLRWIERRLGSRCPKPQSVRSRTSSFTTAKQRSRTSSFTDTLLNGGHGSRAGSPSQMVSNMVIHDKDYRAFMRKSVGPMRMNSLN